MLKTGQHCAQGQWFCTVFAKVLKKKSGSRPGAGPGGAQNVSDERPKGVRGERRQKRARELNNAETARGVRRCVPKLFIFLTVLSIL